MKKWNFFARALCVLTIITFASCNYAGDNSGSNPPEPETPPADVTNLTATCIASGTVKLTWTNSYLLLALPENSIFEKVVITYDTNKTTEVKGTDSPNNEAIITGLTDGKQYTFTVKSYDKSGNESTGVSVIATPHLSPLEITVGTRPQNIQGSQILPTFLAEITDHLYLDESAVNTNGTLTEGDVNDASTFQWYTGTTGNWHAVSSNGTGIELQITITQGTTYYILEAKSADGNSIAYSNVCTVICGGDKTANIGKIAYSDGTYSENYESSKTPIGIIFDVNQDGSPKTIVNLAQAYDKKWCLGSAQGNNKNFTTSYTDGSGNWKIICDNVTDEDTVGNYPAFEYCNKLSDASKSWYLPARDELMKLYYNKKAINTAIEILKDKGVTATALPFGWFWSSSHYISYSGFAGYAWGINFYDGRLYVEGKYVSTPPDGSYVRGVAGF